MKPISRSLLIRAIAYGLAMAYLTMDLFVLHGPLRQRINRHTGAMMAEQMRGPAAVAARVFGHDITMREVDQAVVLASFRSGRPVDPKTLDPGRLFELRVIALQTLLDARAIDAKLTVRPDLHDDAEADRMVTAEESRAGGADALAATLAAAGMSRDSLRAHLRAEAARSRYLEERIEASGANLVDDAAVQTWLDDHKDRMVLPARVKLRHIFKATLHKDPEDVRVRMQSILASLRDATRSFADAAAAESDDASNNTNGGLLGWVEGPDARLPEGLDLAALLAAPLGTPLPPTRTVLGWHIFQVDEIAAAGPVDAATGQKEIRAMLQSTQRREVLPRILNALKHEGDGRLFLTTLRTTPFGIE